MPSVTDLIITEIANVLGISPTEVKNKFTEQQLKELYDLSLCEPIDEVGGPFGEISDLPCEEPAPQLLPDLDTGDIEKLIADLEKTPTDNPVKKCIDAVEVVTKSLDKDRDLYVKYSALYDKLIEYRDNFEPVTYYFEERANELARLINEFSTIIEKQNDLYLQLYNTNNERIKVLDLIKSESKPAELEKKLESINSKIGDLEIKISEQQDLLTNKATSIPIFSNKYYADLVSNLDENSSAETIAQSLSNLYTNYLDFSQLYQIQAQISQYSQCIQVIEDFTPPTTIDQAAIKSFFKFKINFPQLSSFKFESQSLDPKTNTYITEKTDFPFKGNPLIEKQTFFEDNLFFSASELNYDPTVPLTGKIYVDYYNLLQDPLNNFFTLDDRGLSTESSAIDPKVKGTDSEKKRENNSEYFVKDLDKLQQFYQNFETTFENKKNEKRAQVIDPAKDGIKALFKNIARREIQFIFAIGRINKFSPNASSTLLNIVEETKKQNSIIVLANADLNSEITRIKQKLDELKATPENVKEKLKKQSPECFKSEPQPEECESVRDKLGIDPLFLKSIKEGTDPTLPCSTQLCYWVQFSLIANLMGLLPMPNLPNFNQLRYWPVGLTIPTPGGLLKIPLPVIWLPLVVISTPMGTLVIFLTINGIFISPIIFFVSSSGFKQHIFTVRGASPKFGFSANEESIKPGIKKSVAFLANQDKIKRLAKEITDGKDFNLNPAQKVQAKRQRNLLDLAEKEAKSTGNKNKLLKVSREKKNLEKSVSNLGQYEKLQEILDKTESAKDAIEVAKRAIYQRINDLGKPQMAKSDAIKSKIIERQNKLLSNLQKALVDGNLEEAKSIRKQVKVDGIDINDKLEAIKADMLTYFNRLKFPKITIPKDSSKLEPKPNAIFDFLHEVLDFASIYRSNFTSTESLKVKNMLMVELAKSKKTIKKKIEEENSDGTTFNIDQDFDKIQKYLLNVNATLVDNLKGKGSSAAVKAQASKVNDYKNKVKNEKDPTKKKELQKELEKNQVQFSEIFDNARVKEALALTPVALAAISQIKVDFNPFKPCCKASTFELDLSGLSPVIPIIESVKGILDSYVKSLTPQKFKSLVGGKTSISTREITSAYTGILKKAVPSNLSIPVPALNLLTFTASFSGILASLFELKIPNPAAVPFSLPKRVKIDLNLLKPILSNGLMEFLENSLPDPKAYTPPTIKSISPSVDSNNPNGIILESLPPASVKLDSGVEIIDCEPDTSQRSAISSGIYQPQDQAIRAVKEPTSSLFSSGNILFSSNRDVLPSFSTLDSDFLSVNPSDLLAILKNFVDLGFNIAEKILDQFYKILNGILSAKDVNLNLLESIQYSVPSIIPFSPPYLPTFSALTVAKGKSSKSTTTQMIDLDEVEKKLKLVEQTLGPIAKSPLPMLAALAAGVADHVTSAVTLPPIPKIDAANYSFSMVDSSKPSYLTIRKLHPLVSQDDIPSWERLSPANPLFLLFVDQFLANGADKVGLFREYL